jgi:Tol biopolymer transport system component/predicted Ser/Thr protein kinase
MALSVGTRLGPYEILAQIGEGGMGEVYRARDTRLDRAVALKVSKDEFSERFEREAQLIATLNHPHICTLHDVGPNYLVMEFVDGKPLAGPLPVADALRIAAQIADALDHAHRHGIVHRDLKPANILLTKSGVKVLDFGLAKFEEKPLIVGAAEGTRTIGLTQQGTILGTPQYMAPEQVEGQGADTRSDIFSFGAVLYEMLTGAKAFDGRSAASIMASVMKEQPPITPDYAGPAEPVLRRCLAKDPDDRFQTARDLKWALEKLAGQDLQRTSGLQPGSSRRLGRLPWAVATLAVIAAAGITWAWWREAAPELQPLRFSIEAPPETRFANGYFATAVSPDGRLLVFGAQRQAEGTVSLWLRPMDSLTARELPGTTGGNGMFWSPDSKSIGFAAAGMLKRVDAVGGSPQPLCEAPGFEGGSWSKEGTVLFSSNGIIQRVPAGGGTATPVTALDTSHRETAHRSPYFLPDGKSFLFTVLAQDQSVQGIHAATLDQPKLRARLANSDAKGVYAPPRAGQPGYLLWLRNQTLLAQRFDDRKLRVEGDPFPVAEEVATGAGAATGRRAAYWVSSTGLLLYRVGEGAGLELHWIGRDGKAEALPAAGRNEQSGDPRISPDGSRVALERTGSGDPGASGNFDIWVYEFARGVATRLTFGPGNNVNPVWSPDGRQIVFGSNRGGAYQIYRKDAAGTGQEERLTDGPNSKTPMDWSRDGRYLLYQELHPQSQLDLWALPLLPEKPQDRKPIPLLQTQFNERQAQFSPDGNWIAYMSDESGSAQVYIQPFPPSGGKWQVSTSGGGQPRWRGDGKEIYYISGGRMWAAGIRTGRQVIVDSPHDLFPALRIPGPEYFYDVTSDGQRFLAIQGPGVLDDRGNSLTVVSNWQASLKQ